MVVYLIDGGPGDGDLSTLKAVKDINKADVMPFLFFIAIPKSSITDRDHPVNKGIMFFQSNGVYGAKSKTTELLKLFSKKQTNSSFTTRNVAPGAFLDQLFKIGKLKKMHLIRNKFSPDDSDQLNDKFYGREELIVSQFISNKLDDIFDKLRRFGLNPQAIYEWESGTQYQDVKVDIEIEKGIYRTVDLHHFEKRSILEYIPTQYKKENGHANEETILPYFIDKSKSYLDKMAVSLSP